MRFIKGIFFIGALIIFTKVGAQSLLSEIRKCEKKVGDHKYYKYDSILFYAKRQLEYARLLNDSVEIGKAHLSMAFAYYNLENGGEDLSHLLSARKTFSMLKNDSLYFLATLEMASMYKEAISEHFQPDSLLHSAINFFKHNKSKELEARCYMEMGLILRNKYNRISYRDSILFYYTKAKQLSDEIGNQHLSNAINNNIADYYLLNPQKNLDTVVYLSNQVIYFPSENVKNKTVATLNTYIALKEMGDSANIQFLKTGYNLSTQVKPARLQKQAARLLYTYYKNKGVYDSALFFFQESIKLTSNNSKDHYEKLLWELNANESELIKKENAILEDNINLKNRFMYVLVFAFFILLFFILVVIRANNIISIKNKDLKKKKEHNERLLKEIHHRVKNNLQMIVGLLDLQQSSIKNKAVSLVLNDAGSRVKSIALIHQNLYKGDSDMVSVGFKKYIEELSDNLIYSYNLTDKLEVEFNVEELVMPFNKAVILGLLITEIITNALKHAFLPEGAGILKIMVKNNSEKGVELIVTDNGVGLPANFDKNQNSFGVDLINSFVNDLNGEIEFIVNNGTTVKVTLKDFH